MMTIIKQPVPIAESNALEWKEHPRIKNIFIKTLLTSADNALANVSLVKIPVGSAVARHLHPKEVETVYLLQGQGSLILGETETSVKAGQVVAIPKGLEHELINNGDEPIELIAFFTPPIT